MEQEIYDLIQTGDEVQDILNKSEQLPSIEQLTQELNGKADVTDLEEEAADRAAGDAAVGNDLTAGTLVPKLSENLENWNDRDDLAVESSFDDVVRTTAGDESINSELGAQIVSLKAVTDFSASALKATGFNLLRNAVTVSGGGYYFLVPKLTFGNLQNIGSFCNISVGMFQGLFDVALFKLSTGISQTDQSHIIIHCYICGKRSLRRR